METLWVTESKPKTLSLTAEVATALVSAGQQLVAPTRPRGEDDEVQDERSIVQCVSLGDGKWQVTVANAVGVIAIPGLQLLVKPKIPQRHLLFLLGHTEEFRSIHHQVAQLQEEASLWQVVARWFTSAAEDVLRLDLIRDYREVSKELFFGRGTMDALKTARLYYQGRLEFSCRFDEFTVDTPLNRVLKGAARVVAGSSLLPYELRWRARRLSLRMDEVGDLTAADLLASTDRRTAHYKAAIRFAKVVIKRSGRFVGQGDAYAWTFLIPTPLLVEEGILNVLETHLAPSRSVQKQVLPMEGTEKTLNPDLYFDAGAAVGDVKYKVDIGDWRRADLYQVIAFAVGASTSAACVIGFRTQDVPHLTQVGVGNIRVMPFSWDTSDDVAPSESAAKLSASVEAWLSNEVGTSVGHLVHVAS